MQLKSTIFTRVGFLRRLSHLPYSTYLLINENTGKDDEFDTFILDEERLCDYLDPFMTEGGYIVDFHSPEFFPESWFELVLVLRTNTEHLYDRLSERGYSTKKINENMECEIMQEVLVSQSYIQK